MPRARDLEQQIDRSLAALPGEQAARDRLRYAADAPRGEHLQRRAGRRRGRRHPRAALVPLRAARRAHTLEKKGGGGFCAGHDAADFVRPNEPI